MILVFTFRKCMICFWCIFGLFFSLASYAVPSDAVEHVVWLSLTDSEFKKYLKEYKKKGYMPIDFEVVVDGDDRTYTLIMKKAAKPEGFVGRYAKAKWAIRKELASKEFKDVWRSFLRKGYRPIDMESYEYGGQQYYGAIWLKDKEVSWVSYRDLSLTEFDLVWDEAKASNQIPVDINAYANLGKLKLSAIFVDNDSKFDWALDRKVSYQKLPEHITQMTKDGYRMLDSSAYINGSSQYYTVLWLRDGVDWRFEREAERSAFDAAMVRYEDEGFGLVDVEVYVTRIGLRYTGIWVKE